LAGKIDYPVMVERCRNHGQEQRKRLRNRPLPSGGDQGLGVDILRQQDG